MDWKIVIDELTRYLIEDWEDYYVSFDAGFSFIADFARSKDIIMDYEGVRRRWRECQNFESSSRRPGRAVEGQVR